MDKSILFSKIDHIKTFGNSMYPLLHSDDIVFFEKVPWNYIKVDDIILFQTRKQVITHRVIYKNNSYLLTKGDNILRADQPVLPSQIIGKLTSVKRNGSHIYPEIIYTMQSGVYINQIKLVCTILRKHSIPFVILKGLPLHLHYEKRHPRRLYADCDILLHKSDKEKVMKLFKKTGYTVTQLDESKHAETSYTKMVNGVPVVFDIHYEPVFMMTSFDVGKYFYSKDLLHKMTEEFISNQRKVVYDTFTYPILQQEYLVMYLAMHFFHHNFRSPARIRILIKIITSTDWNYSSWKKLQEITLRYHLENIVFPTFLILNKYYNINPPPIVMTSLKSKSIFLNFIIFLLIRQSIFNEDSPLTAGVKRMIYIFILSPSPIIKKMSILKEKVLWENILKVILRLIKGR